VSVQLVSTSRRHRHDRDHPQISENDKGASRQRQILLPSGSLTPFFRYVNLVPFPYGWRLGYTYLRGRGTKPGATEGATVDWYGTTRSYWYGTTRTRHRFPGPMVRASFTPGDLWSNPVVVADLLQLWTDAQSAAGGGARSGLN